MGQCQLKCKENQDACAITEVAVLNVHGANEIRELYREICEVPENPCEIELQTNQSIGNGCKSVGGIQEANSADRIDQLNALRFEMQSGKRNLSRGESGFFWK